MNPVARQKMSFYASCTTCGPPTDVISEVRSHAGAPSELDVI